MVFAIRRQPPLLDGTNFQTFFYPTFFLLQLNPTYMKRILHLVPIKNIVVKSSFNWFKIDIHQQLRPLTANYLAMFKVISTTISGLWPLSPRHSFGVYASLGVLLPDKKMSRCGSGLRLVKSLKKKSENVMQRYIESKSNIINHQPSNYALDFYKIT